MTSTKNQKSDANIDRESLLKVLYDEPVRIGQWCGLDRLGDLHNRWLRNFLYGHTDMTLLAHRGSYKTTVGSLFLALTIILFPNTTIIYIRKTDTAVKEVVRQVINLLNSGCFKLMVRVLYGVELRLTKATDNEVKTNLATSVKGSSQLIAVGIGGSITGKHADLIYTDDIVGPEDRVSHAEREKTKLYYQELQNIRNPGGRIVNTGTPWHKEDCIAELMPAPKVFDCYHTGMLTQEQLQGLRASMSPSLFAANYELKHIADADALFGEPHWATGSYELIYDGIGHLDAAYGGADGTAMTVLKKTGNGRFVGYGRLWRGRHVDTLYEQIKNIHTITRCGTVHCEDNGDKGFVKAALNKNGVRAQSYHEKENKYIKISTYLKSCWELIDWLPETDPEYLSEILDYTEHAEHDDAPDSAASLCRILDTRKARVRSKPPGL